MMTEERRGKEMKGEKIGITLLLFVFEMCPAA